MLPFLEEKLSVVEKEFSEKLRLFQLDKNQGMEEKLLAVQRKYEMQKRKELQEEVCNGLYSYFFSVNCRYNQYSLLLNHPYCTDFIGVIMVMVYIHIQ